MIYVYTDVLWKFTMCVSRYMYYIIYVYCIYIQVSYVHSQYIRIEIIVSFKINDYVYILYILSGSIMLIHVGYLILLSRSLSFCSARPRMSIQVNRMAFPGPCGKESVSRLIFLVPNSGLLHDWFLQVDLGRMITAFPPVCLSKKSSTKAAMVCASSCSLNAKSKKKKKHYEVYGRMSSVNVWRAQTGAWAISPTLRLKIDSTHLVRRFFTPAECSWRNFWWRRFEFGDPTQEPGFPTNKYQAFWLKIFRKSDHFRPMTWDSHDLHTCWFCLCLVGENLQKEGDWIQNINTIRRAVIQYIMIYV